MSPGRSGKSAALPDGSARRFRPWRGVQVGHVLCPTYYAHIAEALREATRQTLIEAEKYHWNAVQADQARQHAFMRILSKRCGFRYHQESE